LLGGIIRQGLGFSIGLQAVNGLSPLLLLPISLPRLGPDAYGVYVHALVISNMLAGVLVLGFFSHLSRLFLRETAEGQESPFARLVVFQCSLSLVATLLNLFIVLLFIETHQEVYLIATISTLLSGFNVDWYYYSKLKIKVLFWRTLIARMLIIGLAAFLVVDSKDLLLFVGLVVLANSTGNMAALIWAWKTEKIVMYLPKLSDYLSARHFFGSSIIGSVQQYADQIIVGAAFSMSELAHLSLCRQVLSACAGFTQAICRVMMPLSIKNHRECPSTFFPNVMLRARIFLIGVGGVAILIACFGDPLLSALSKDRFEFGFLVMSICAVCFFITSASIYIDTQISIPALKEYVTTHANILVAMTFLLGLIFTTTLQSFDYRFALLSLFAAESIGVLAMVYFLHRLGIFKKVQI
jgi:O-antigen/teichoic acid export membrane protein